MNGCSGNGHFYLTCLEFVPFSGRLLHWGRQSCNCILIISSLHRFDPTCYMLTRGGLSKEKYLGGFCKFMHCMTMCVTWVHGTEILVIITRKALYQYRPFKLKLRITVFCESDTDYTGAELWYCSVMPSWNHTRVILRTNLPQSQSSIMISVFLSSIQQINIVSVWWTLNFAQPCINLLLCQNAER